jgi:hypothetical protein
MTTKPLNTVSCARRGPDGSPCAACVAYARKWGYAIEGGDTPASEVREWWENVGEGGSKMVN